MSLRPLPFRPVLSSIVPVDVCLHIVVHSSQLRPFPISEQCVHCMMTENSTHARIWVGLERFLARLLAVSYIHSCILLGGFEAVMCRLGCVCCRGGSSHMFFLRCKLNCLTCHHSPDFRHLLPCWRPLRFPFEDCLGLFCY